MRAANGEGRTEGRRQSNVDLRENKCVAKKNIDTI